MAPLDNKINVCLFALSLSLVQPDDDDDANDCANDSSVPT